MTLRSEILPRKDAQDPQPRPEEQSAREFLESVAWEGEPPDPDLLSGREFLAWL